MLGHRQDIPLWRRTVVKEFRCGERDCAPARVQGQRPGFARATPNLPSADICYVHIATFVCAQCFTDLICTRITVVHAALRAACPDDPRGTSRATNPSQLRWPRRRRTARARQRARSAAPTSPFGVSTQRVAGGARRWHGGLLPRGAFRDDRNEGGTGNRRRDHERDSPTTQQRRHRRSECGPDAIGPRNKRAVADTVAQRNEPIAQRVEQTVHEADAEEPAEEHPPAVRGRDQTDRRDETERTRDW